MESKTNKLAGEQRKLETDIIKSGRNYYAAVGGFVYHLKAFGDLEQARKFAAHLYSQPSFAAEFGWTASHKFQAREAVREVNAEIARLERESEVQA